MSLVVRPFVHNRFGWFEQTNSQAAKVRNVSNVGSRKNQPFKCEICGSPQFNTRTRPNPSRFDGAVPGLHYD